MKIKYHFLIAGIIAVSFSFGQLSAQERDSIRVHELQEVTVKENHTLSVVRSETPLQVVSGEDINRLGYQDMADVVRRFSGVAVRDYGGIGGLKTVSVRSLGAHHTTVSYDGVVVGNCQAGQIDIGRFSLDNINMITLAVGQENNIFQPARMLASGGVLGIRTHIPFLAGGHKSELQLQIKGGAFGMINPSLRYSQRLSKQLTLSVNGNYLRADGNYPFKLVNGNFTTKEKRKNSAIESYQAEANLYYQTNRSLLSFKTYYFDSERGLPGVIILYNPYNRERLWDKLFFSQLQYKHALSGKWSLLAQLKYNYSWNKYEDVNVKYESGKQIDRHTQNEYYASLVVRYTPSGRLETTLASDFFINTLKSDFPDASDPRRITVLTALSACYRTSIYTLTGNLLSTHVTENVEVGKAVPDRNKITPSIAFILHPWSKYNLNFRLLYKKTYRQPTFNDLYYQRVGNRDLKPESAHEYNVGMTWKGRPFSFVDHIGLTVDVYYNKVEDKIVALPTMYIWRMMNVGKVRIGGADVTLSAGIPLSEKIILSLSGGYTYQKAINITDKSAKNYKHQIPYTPRHCGNAGVTVEMPWVNLSYTAIGVSGRYILPQNTAANKIDGYVEQSLTAFREFNMKNSVLRLQADLVNITDEQYDVIKYYPMPGRAYRLTVSLRI